MSRSIRTRFLVALLAAAAAIPPAVCGTPAETVLGGMVSDATGSPIDGVELLLGRAGASVLSAQSDPSGRYRFRGVVPGSYLLLATKVGYRATLAQVNTVTEGSLDLTLQLLGDPLPPGAATPPRPENESWALRLPARDVLRETGQEPILTTRGDDPAGAGPAASRRFNAEVQQWFSMALGAVESEGNPLDEGRATSFHLGGAATEAVAWSVDGGAARTAAAFDAGALRELDDENRRVLVNFNVDADAENRVDISAWYDQADRAYMPALEADELAGQRRRGWGYGARWSGRVGATSDVDVHLGYRAANLDALDSRSFLAAGGDPLEDQYWSALGAFTFSPGAGHQVRLGVQASFREHNSEDMRLAADPPLVAADSPIGTGLRGWSVNVFGKESYEIVGPLALDLGLDLHHLGFEQPVSYVLPQAGVTYRPGEADTVRAVVMAKFADGGDPLGAETGGETSRLGYMLAWDRQLGLDVAISIAAAIKPYAQERLLADEYVAFDPATRQPLFLSDGNATSREISLRLERRFGGFHAAGGVRYGEVEGTFLSALPNDLPVQRLGQDQARFVSTSLRTAYVPTGTRVAVDFQRVENDNLSLTEEAVAPLTYSSLEVVLQQQIAHHPGRGAWSLMVGYQELLNVSDGESGEEELAQLGVPAQLRQVRGGVSVRF